MGLPWIHHTEPGNLNERDARKWTKKDILTTFLIVNYQFRISIMYLDLLDSIMPLMRSYVSLAKPRQNQRLKASLPRKQNHHQNSVEKQLASVIKKLKKPLA